MKKQFYYILFFYQIIFSNYINPIELSLAQKLGFARFRAQKNRISLKKASSSKEKNEKPLVINNLKESLNSEINSNQTRLFFKNSKDIIILKIDLSQCSSINNNACCILKNINFI